FTYGLMPEEVKADEVGDYNKKTSDVQNKSTLSNEPLKKTPSAELAQKFNSYRNKPNPPEIRKVTPDMRIKAKSVKVVRLPRVTSMGKSMRRKSNRGKKLGKMKSEDPSDVITQDVMEDSPPTKPPEKGKKESGTDGKNSLSQEKTVTQAKSSSAEGSRSLEGKVQKSSNETIKEFSLTDNRYVWSQNILQTMNTITIRKEFIQNKNYKPPEYTCEHFKRNISKNRYEDVLCIDSTRVVLKERTPDTDYIHASWVDMPDGQRYISTQGPLQETLEDFWHMVYTEKSYVIVMLCCLREGNNEKCFLYFPRNSDECGKYGNYKVYFKEIVPNNFSSVKHHILTLKNVRRKDSYDVHHISYSEWPDYTAPLDPAPTVGLLKLVRNLSRSNPIVVHCSGGIGRSVCFIGVDYIAQKVKGDSNAKMIDMLKDLRNRRFQGVQGIIQYTYLHVCVLELFVQEGVLPREGKYTEFLNAYVNMLTRYNRRMAELATREEEKDEKKSKIKKVTR
ncbi:hypothetical protein V3C99_010140, partial [Haemonchus contortus]